MDRGQLAYDNFLKGYNCSQSVIMAYSDFFPEESLETVIKISSSFGGGMGRLREVCGTVSGAFMVLGEVYGYKEAGDGERKKDLYARIQEFAARFEKENGSIVCRTLLGLKGKSDAVPEKRTKEYYLRRPCPGYCRSSASLLQQYLMENGVLDEEGKRI